MKLTVTVDGHRYEVDVEVSEPEPYRPVAPLGTQVRMPAAVPVAPPARGGAPDSAGPDRGDVCRSPVNGMVVRVIAQPGQAVQVGDVLLVLEAMKMETNLTAPVAATVSKVNVAVSDAVKAGQILVEFEQ